ncbi:MAG: fenitrothion hydrolase, partial [Gaiellaceae bacterium]
VLVVSFVLIGLLWKRPLLERHGRGRSLPDGVQSVLRSLALRIVLGAASVFLLVLTLATALFGTTIELLNFAPTFVYVIFWLGLPLLSVLFGNVWTVLSPWRSIADATVWTMQRLGFEAKPVLDTPWRMGRYPAAVALFAFVALELAHPRPAYPRTLGVAVALYSYWALAGMAVFGRDTWTRSGEGFAVAFELLSRIAPFAVREGAVVVRWPLTGLAGADRVPGTLVFVGVLLGSTSFDGFSRSSVWQNLLADVRRSMAGEPAWAIDLATTVTNIGGLALFVGAVVVTYLVAVEGARRLVHAPRSLVPDFVLPLVPIAFAYLVAHYFSLFVIQGQFIYSLASDPFGRGWDLFGTVDFAPNLTIVSPETVWYVQVGALVVGHVAGLAIAHDRAVALFEDRRDALRSQYPMLGLMVLYTVGGLWVLSQG